jgi:hypothetical protein
MTDNTTTDETNPGGSRGEIATESAGSQADADKGHSSRDLQCWTVYPLPGAMMEVRFGGCRIENPGGDR